jgi:hypothetical protein
VAFELNRYEDHLTVVVHRQGCDDLRVPAVLIIEPYVIVSEGWTVTRCPKCLPKYGVIVRSRTCGSGINAGYRTGSARSTADWGRAVDVPVRYTGERVEAPGRMQRRGRLGEWLK